MCVLHVDGGQSQPPHDLIRMMKGKQNKQQEGGGWGVTRRKDIGITIWQFGVKSREPVRTREGKRDHISL